MCGIAGSGDRGDVEALNELMDHRGESIGLEEAEDFFLGHVLHPVVGEVDQPLSGEGLLVANCEIYNWKDLSERYGFEARNDAELLLKLLEEKGQEALEELDGIYAFAYLEDGEILVGRDLLGVNPVWYSEDPFVFASEKQALEELGLEARELHPRKVLRYDLDSRKLSTESRKFLEVEVEDRELEEAVKEVKERFTEAVKKRVPDGEVALLFSGGVDSTMVAAALKEIGKDFTCYTAGIEHGNVDSPRDVEWARKVANMMELDLRVNESDLEEVEENLQELSDWVSTTSVVKLGVALPFHLSLAGDEKVVFSGLGSEQLYAGYHRHQGYLNKECLSGLRNLYERDLYRDNVVCFRNGYEVRLPFLDPGLVEHALKLPEDFKVRDGYRKYVLRKAAEELGVPEEVVWRKKTAAQYGSNFDKAISRLAKDRGFGSKQEYLNSLRDEPNNKLVALTSGGKDSNAALYRMQRRNNKISCLLTLRSENKDSYMFDSKKSRKDLEWQSERLGIPLVIQETEGEKEVELEDLKEGLRKVRDEYDVDGAVAGALASTYQRDRVEKVAEEIGLKVFAPLWRENQENYMRWLMDKGFRVQVTDVAARGLDDSWVGEVLDTEYVEELVELSGEYGFNAAGEGGEYETMVVDFPEEM